MNIQFLILFIGLTVANVIIQTIKSIATIKCGKTVAALINAVAYGLYTYVIFFTNADGMALWLKALITALANLIGVWLVKFFEERARKDKLWKVEVTIPKDKMLDAVRYFSETEVPFNYIDINKYCIFNFYCSNKKQSELIRDALKIFDAKFFVSESKEL